MFSVPFVKVSPVFVTCNVALLKFMLDDLLSKYIGFEVVLRGLPVSNVAPFSNVRVEFA